MQLRPYQIQGFNSIFSAWDNVDIIMFVLATGGGKTVTFVEVIKKLLAEGKQGMLIAHREELIFQAHSTLWRSGITAGIIKADVKPLPYCPIQVCSIQTLARRKNLPPADFIVIDEAHHVQDDNTYCALLAKYPLAKVLMVTATPYRLSGKGFKNIYPGKEVHLIVNCTIKALINDGWLVPIKYFVGSMPNLDNIKLIKGEYDDASAENEMKLAPIVASYKEHCNGLSGICFCITVAHSISVAQDYNSAGVPAAHIDAETPSCKQCFPGCGCRKDILQKFRAGVIKIVCNVGILTEGADFPLCDFVQLAAPTKSLSKYLQEVGRATRTLPNILNGCDTAAERRGAIAASKKPYGIIIDNAGLWRDHGFPDDNHDWEHYFNGWVKPPKKKEEELEMIEIPVFEIEDPLTGARRRVNDAKETEGMILVEITKELRVNFKSIKHLKEFDRLVEISRAPHNQQKINKPGYFAFYGFMKYCEREGIEMTDPMWKYMRTVLVDNIEAEVDAYIGGLRNVGLVVAPGYEQTVEAIKKKGVHKHFLKREYEDYKQKLVEKANIEAIKNRTPLQTLLQQLNADIIDFK